MLNWSNADVKANGFDGCDRLVAADTDAAAAAAAGVNAQLTEEKANGLAAVAAAAVCEYASAERTNANGASLSLLLVAKERGGTKEEEVADRCCSSDRGNAQSPS